MTQQQQPHPTITVKGVGRVSVEPDRVVLSFSVHQREGEYGEAIEGLNARVEELRQAIEACDLDRKELKTSDFSVERATRYDDREHGHVFVGYVASHQLRFGMPLDQRRLNAVLGSISASLAEASFDIHFETSREAELQDEVLAAAVDDARRKATLLAAAAGARLGALLHIGHSWSEISFSSGHYRLSDERCYSAPAPDIEPEQISSSDSVEVVWALA